MLRLFKFFELEQEILRMNEIVRDIEKAYGSLQRPNWTFVAKHAKAGLYDHVIDQLTEIGCIEETTDYNDDTSRCVSITLGSHALTMRLSLVGSFACIHNADGRVLSEAELHRNALGQALFEVLKANGSELLEQDVLRAEINFGEGKSSVYEALFSSDEMVA